MSGGVGSATRPACFFLLSVFIDVLSNVFLYWSLIGDLFVSVHYTVHLDHLRALQTIRSSDTFGCIRLIWTAGVHAGPYVSSIHIQRALAIPINSLFDFA
jgi:hypothetical protein